MQRFESSRVLRALKEAWLSLAAGQAMVPFGDNGPALRALAERVSALRSAGRAPTHVSARPAVCSTDACALPEEA